MNLYKKLNLLIFVWIIIASWGCKDDIKKIAEYSLTSIDKTGYIELSDWNVLGPIKYSDTTCSHFLDRDHLSSSGISELSFCKDPYSRIEDCKLSTRYKFKDFYFKGLYSSADPLIDLSSLKVIPEDLKGSATYFYCIIKADKNIKKYLLTRSRSDGIKIWLNNIEVCNKDTLSLLDEYYSEFTPLNLTKGNNIVTIKLITFPFSYRAARSRIISFESKICNKKVLVEELYKRTCDSFLKNPIIKDDSLHFRIPDYSILDTTITVSFTDVSGNRIYSEQWNTSLPSLHVSGLSFNHSYLCHFSIDSVKFSQPVFKGNIDTVYNVFDQKNEKFINNKDTLIQIETLMYRLRNLKRIYSILPLRKIDGNWSYQAKLAILSYEIENLIYNLENKKNISANTFGIQLRGYTSKLDSSTQHYLLITPDNYIEMSNIPLVLVIRPYIEKIRNFLISPQIARYSALANAKRLATKYGYIILMPAGRLYLKEPLIPMARAELIEAINEVKDICSIDTSRIYLHGNCTAGYRCLNLATHYPDKFAAIAMYSTTYDSETANEWQMKNSIKYNIENLTNTSIFLHRDPLDTHLPYSSYKELVTDCRENNVDIVLSESKGSVSIYNASLVGEEAFKYFVDKRKKYDLSEIKFSFHETLNNSIGWLECFSKVRGIKSNISAKYIQSSNAIDIKGDNISKIILDLTMLKTSHKKPLLVNYNGKILFNEHYNEQELVLKISPIIPLETNYARNNVIADLFYNPFLFVLKDTVNSSSMYKSVVDSLRKEYRTYLFADMPTKYESELDNMDLDKYNLFLIGHNFKDSLLRNLISNIDLEISSEQIRFGDQLYRGSDIIFQSVFYNPEKPNKLVVVYSSNKQNRFKHIINCPWKKSLSNIITKENN